MKCRQSFRSVFLIFFVFIKCGTEQKQVEIIVSKALQKAIYKAVPVEKYRFYAQKESFPKSIEEMTEVKLFVCGKVETEADVKIMQASLDELDKPLFKSISRFTINSNLLSGHMVISEDVSITLENGEIIKYPRENSIYGKETVIDTLVQKCFEEMQKNNKSVLLINKNFDNDVLGQMVEIVFK